MRKNKAMTAILACTMALQAPVAAGAAATLDNNAKAVVSTENTLQTAAKKKGLKRERGKYYYYKNGVKVKNNWLTLKRNGKYYKYYFGANGAAYAGTKVYGTSVPAVKKISGAYYGFDRLGHMLKGTYVANNKFYVFSSKNGKMNGTLSVKLRSACKYKKSTATLKRLLKNIGLKPLKTQKLEGCYGDGYDVIYTYKNFQISAHENLDGTEIFLGLIAR